VVPVAKLIHSSEALRRFDDNSIFGHVEAGSNRSFAKFSAALRDLNSQLPPTVEFRLPQVVVVGGRSAGKSNLMENVTKCSMFPVDEELCTRMPIKLQLKQVASATDCSVTICYQGRTLSLTSKEEVLGHVQQIMKEVDGISNEEVTIQICQVSCFSLCLHLQSLSHVQTCSVSNWRMVSCCFVSQVLMSH